VQWLSFAASHISSFSATTAFAYASMRFASGSIRFAVFHSSVRSAMCLRMPPQASCGCQLTTRYCCWCLTWSFAIIIMMATMRLWSLVAFCRFRVSLCIATKSHKPTAGPRVSD
jgi:hypothetical protein